MRMISKLFLLGFLGAFASSVSAADVRLENTIAAINLGEIGKVHSQAPPLVVAREMLASMAPSGSAIKHLTEEIEAEARFALRGKREQALRLDRLPERTPDPTLLIEFLSESYRVPPGFGMSGIAVPDRVRLISVMAGTTPVCEAGISAQVWVCDPGKAISQLTITAEFEGSGHYMGVTISKGKE